MNQCIFCKISRNEIPIKFIYENDNFFSIFDNNPKTEKHTLIISKKHFKTILDMPTTMQGDLIEAIKKTFIIINKQEEFSGFNILQNNFKSAGQSIDHLHFHLLPRKEKDNLKLLE